MDLLHDRCAGLDVSKKDVKACMRTPGPRANQRHTEVRTFATTTNALLQLRDWLIEQRVTLVAMEATGDYWDSQKLHQMGSWSDGSAGVGGLSHVLFTQESRLLGCGFVRLIPFDA